MPIKKLVPKVPDPYIGKNEQNQFWPARFGHLDYLIEQINNGGAIPEGFSRTYTELITIPGSTWSVFPGPQYINFPANGLSQQLINEGNYIIPISFIISILETAPPALSPLTLSQMQFSIWNNTYTGGTAITNEFSIGGPTGPYPQASVAYVPAIRESNDSIAITAIPIDPLGTKFRLEAVSGGGGSFGTADNCLKIAFTFVVIDLNWFFKLTN